MVRVEKKRSYYKEPVALTCSKYFFLVLFSIFFLFPVYALVINSFVPDTQLDDMSLWPAYFDLSTYTRVFNTEYLTFFLNTLKVCFLNISGVCIASSLTAYAISKLDFWGKDFVFACIMGMILLPSTVLSIPLYLIYARLEWIGTLYPLWVPMWFGGGTMNIFLVRQFMRGIPKSYSEAACLDGATNFQIYYKIIMPLVKPILIYLAVTGFFGNWNDFQGPLMYVGNKRERWTLSLALYKIFGESEGSTDVNNLPNVQMAVGVTMMIPCVILFAFFQRTIMEGISVIGIKG